MGCLPQVRIDESSVDSNSETMSQARQVDGSGLARAAASTEVRALLMTFMLRNWWKPGPPNLPTYVAIRGGRLSGMATLMIEKCLRLSMHHQGTSSHRIQRTIAQAGAFMCRRAPVDPRLAKMSKNLRRPRLYLGTV